jgi:GT2 family glycosyltransferase
MIPGRKTGRVYRSGWSSQLPIRRTAPVDHLIGCNMAYRTDVLRGYRFNPEFQGYALGEDLELSHRLVLDGHRLLCVGSAHIWHISGRARHDRAWGYREMVIRPIVAGSRFSRLAFLPASVAFVFTNAIRNPERARGNLMGIADVLRRRELRDLQTLTNRSATPTADGRRRDR